MTRSGDASERRRRIRLGYTPGADGTLHSPQPVEPEGRRKRRKPSGHKHTEGQPAEDHGADHDAGGADENPHTTATANPHAVTHSQVGAPTGNPHGVTASEAGAVANAVGAPSKRRDTRANQPAPANVAVGSEYRVKDEAEVLEVATDTDGDGTADTWVTVSTDPTHDHDGRYVNETGDTMTGALRWTSGTPYVERVDSNGVTWVAELDVLGDDTPAVVVRRDGSAHASFKWDSSVSQWVMSASVKTTHGAVPTQFAVAADSRQQNIDNSDWQANGTDDHLTVQNAIDALPVGTK